MKARVVAILILILAGVLIWVIGYFSSHDSVDAVVDSNTLELNLGRQVHLIGVAQSRFFGYRMPERSYEKEVGEVPTDSVYSLIAVDSLAMEALKDKVVGEPVTLVFPEEFEPDSSGQDLFAYVELKDGTDLNAWMIRQGHAWVHPQHKHPRAEQYREYQKQAREALRGIWGVVPDSLVQEGEAFQPTIEEHRKSSVID